MATFHYRCTEENCEYEEEVVHSMLEDQWIECPDCGNQSLTQVIKPSAFMLKGKDWHGFSTTNGKTKRFGANKTKD